jgi:iron complex outermembrane receptor protein
LLGGNRSFLPYSVPPGPYDLLPENRRRSLYASVRQDLSPAISLASDVLVSDRTSTSKANAAYYGDTSVSAQQLAASLELDVAISSDWTAKLSGQMSREKDLNIGYPPGGAIGLIEEEPYTYKTSSAEAVIDGKLFELPGGALRAALGGQYKRETLDQAQILEGYPSLVYPVGERTSEAAFGELYIPIVGKENSIPFVRQLNLDVAGRYDHYSDFGSTTNPKVALQWVPIEGLTWHGAYSKSFRAPSLYELGAGIARIGEIYDFPNAASPTGTTTTLLLDGSNLNLKPEHANSFTTGFTLKPTALPELKLDLSYFHINYKDRIDRLTSDGFFNPFSDSALGQLGSLVNTNPTIGQVNSAIAGISPGYFYDTRNNYCQVGLSPGCSVNPADVQTIANVGYVNVGVATVQGYDLDAQYKWDGSVGQIFADLDGTLLTENSLQITPTTEPASLLNELSQPLRFRAKMNLGWRKSEWAAYGRVNFANAYHNNQDPNCPELPGCKISSWTTVDSGISYTIASNDHRVGSGLRLALDVANIFNRAPPHITASNQEIPLTYDSVNANPLLRVFAVSITKAW